MTEFSAGLLVLVAASFFLAGLVKGISGMGLPTVAMGLLGALISPLAAASLLVVPSLVTNLWQLLAGPGLLALWARLFPMMLGIVAGTLAGASVLAGGDTQAATGALGAALVAYAGYTLVARQLRVPERMEPWLSPAVGAATGLVTGATGVFVIPAVPYLQALGLSKDDLVQALGLSFTVSTLALATGLLLRGAYSPDDAGLSVLAVLPALLGMWVGARVRRSISPEAFRRWFLAFLLVLGAEMARRPFF